MSEYKQGGWLKPGDTLLIMGRVERPEYILTAEQVKALRDD